MKIRFWTARRQREDDLVRDSDWQAEQAACALRDDLLHDAIRWSDWTVANTRKIYARRRRRGPVDPRVIDVFADRLWDRALIHQELGNVDDAIRDATEALGLLEELPQGGAADPALLVPSCRLLLSELYAQAGNVQAARHHGQAIEAFEQATDWPSLFLAYGYDRYGRAMHYIGDPAAAPALRRAVELYRQQEMLGGRRAIKRFIGTVLLAADSAKPVTAAAAPDVLSMLQDAATRVRRLPHTVAGASPLLPSPQYYADMPIMMDVRSRIAEWLAVLDERQRADLRDGLGEFYPRETSAD